MVDVADAGAGKAGGKPDLILPPPPTIPLNLEKSLEMTPGQHVVHKHVEGGTSKLKNEQGATQGKLKTVGQSIVSDIADEVAPKLKDQGEELTKLRGKLKDQEEELTELRGKLNEHEELVKELNMTIQDHEKTIEDQKELISAPRSPAIAQTDLDREIEKDVDWWIFSQRVMCELGLTAFETLMEEGKDKYICTILAASLVLLYYAIECGRSHRKKPWIQNGELKVKNIVWETELYGLMISFVQLVMFIVPIWKPVAIRLYFQTILFNLCAFLSKMYKRSHHIKKATVDVV